MRPLLAAMAAAVLGAHAIAAQQARPAPTSSQPALSAPLAEPAPVLDLPARSAAAPGGRAFMESTKTLTSGRRQRAIVEQVLAGNVPTFMRRLVPVTLNARDAAVVFVSPDYVSIGSDDDFVRVPLDAPSARAVAGALGCVLPTAEIVDAVYAQAALRLTPDPMPAGAHMVTSEAYLEHQARIERQRAGRAFGELLAGHKKDVVATLRSRRQPGRVAIYGWHQADGAPIQPLSLVHEETYADYSHGLRLVWHRARAGGGWVDVTQITPEASIAAR